MTFNGPYMPFVYLLGFTGLSFLLWVIVMAYIRYEVRMSILDYSNRLKDKQFGPTVTPYDEWCLALHKELGRE